MPFVRVRNHVNPLSHKYQTPIAPFEWDKYQKQTQPLHLDIGCGRGRFLLSMAQLEPNWNFLGLEIREPLVNDAVLKRDEAGLTNLHYLFCNASNSLNGLFSSLPAATKLQRVTIQFPDPWFKNRHAKRRVVQPQLVAELATHLAVGGVVFLQSDIEVVAVEMRDRFCEHPDYQKQAADWLTENPLPVPTERETSTLSRGEPVYRTMFKKV